MARYKIAPLFEVREANGFPFNFAIALRVHPTESRGSVLHCAAGMAFETTDDFFDNPDEDTEKGLEVRKLYAIIKPRFEALIAADPELRQQVLDSHLKGLQEVAAILLQSEMEKILKIGVARSTPEAASIVAITLKGHRITTSTRHLVEPIAQYLCTLHPDLFQGDRQMTLDIFDEVPAIIERAGLTEQFAATIASLRAEITKASGGEFAERERERRARRDSTDRIVF